MGHESSILYEPFNRYIWRHAFGFDVPDHVIMALLVLAISTLLCLLLRSRISRDNPGPLQHFMEMIVDGVKGMLHDIIGHHGDRYLYIIGAFATFIFISNIFGLFFFLQPPTANPNVTFGLAICAFLYYNYHGIRVQGLGHYIAHFAGPVWWLSWFLFPIEIISHIAIDVRGCPDLARGSGDRFHALRLAPLSVLCWSPIVFPQAYIARNGGRLGGTLPARKRERRLSRVYAVRRNTPPFAFIYRPPTGIRFVGFLNPSEIIG